MSNMILPPTKMSNILSKYVYFPLDSLKEKNFTVRSSHLPTHPTAKTKVRGSQFAPSHSP